MSWDGLSRGPSHAPRRFPRRGRDRHRPRPPDRRAPPTSPAEKRGAVRPDRRRQLEQADDAELFRAQMLTEMAAMSLDDGLVMQIHPGSFRNHNPLASSALRPRQGRRHPACAPTTSTR